MFARDVVLPFNHPTSKPSLLIWIWHIIPHVLSQIKWPGSSISLTLFLSGNSGGRKSIFRISLALFQLWPRHCKEQSCDRLLTPRASLRFPWSFSRQQCLNGSVFPFSLTHKISCAKPSDSIPHMYAFTIHLKYILTSCYVPDIPQNSEHVSPEQCGSFLHGTYRMEVHPSLQLSSFKDRQIIIPLAWNISTA